jgi:hypothetical protein
MGRSEKSLETQIAETTGALDVLFTLREEFAQWVEEAQDASKLESLENVLGHVGAMELEFQHRFQDLERKLKAR